MSRKISSEELIIGGEPRVDLLPPEVGARQKSKALRRGLAVAVVAVVVLTGGGVAAASWRAALSQAELQNAQARTLDLLSEQTKYAEVLKVQAEVDTATAARQVGASTEVDWNDYLGKVRALLPPDVLIETVDVVAASPLAPFEQATSPLQEQRVATLMIAVTSPSLPAVPQWLEALQSLPGYADATPGSIKRVFEDEFTVSLTLHIDEGAYSNRFASTEEK
jgi:hypothetical protein